jgi:hypothetical protein
MVLPEQPLLLIQAQVAAVVVLMLPLTVRTAAKAARLAGISKR